MKTVLTYQNNQLLSITFTGWQENRGRMANIDLDLVRSLGSLSVRPDPDGDHFDPETYAKVFEHIHGFPWSVEEQGKIKKVIAGYCIEPETNTKRRIKMSWEGYYQLLCEDGHSIDGYDYTHNGKCHCGKEIVWWNTARTSIPRKTIPDHIPDDWSHD